jgi:flagellar assembly protein FliH
MLRLWSGMLQKMLHHEITLTPDGIFKVLADVLSRLSDKNHVLIYVSPDDIGLLEDKLDGEFGEILRGVKHLELKPDAHVDKGSCIVETNLGIYDARWRTQFDQIETVVESLFRKLGKAPQAKEKATTRESRSRSKNKKTEASENA